MTKPLPGEERVSSSVEDDEAVVLDVVQAGRNVVRFQGR